MKKLIITIIALLGFATFALSAVHGGGHQNGVTVGTDWQDDGFKWRLGEPDGEGGTNWTNWAPASWNDTTGGIRKAAPLETTACRIMRVGRKGGGQLQEQDGVDGNGNAKWKGVKPGKPGVAE